MMENVSIRMHKRFMKEAEKLARIAMVDKSTIIREALDKGFAGVRLKIATELFGEGKVSTSEAAEISGLSVGELMDEVVKRGLKLSITREDLAGSLERALKIVK